MADWVSIIPSLGFCDWVDKMEAELLYRIGELAPGVERVYLEKAHTAIMDLIEYRKKREEKTK